MEYYEDILKTRVEENIYNEKLISIYKETFNLQLQHEEFDGKSIIEFIENNNNIDFGNSGERH